MTKVFEPEPWNGIDASDRVQEWAATQIDWLQRHPECKDGGHIHSGDTMVMVERSNFLADKPQFRIYVLKIESVTDVPADIEVNPERRWPDAPKEEQRDVG